MRRHVLLAGLPRKDRLRIAEKLELVSLPANLRLYDSHMVIHDVFFPLSAVLSLSGTTAEGAVVEIGQIGREGVAGVETAFRTLLCGHPLASMLVENSGTALRMKAVDFAEEVDQYASVNRCVRRYMGYWFLQLQLSTACNRHHPLVQRCARRLLTAQDLTGTADQLMTQYQLAQMLGTSRQSVERVLKLLHKNHIVALSRGCVRIEDRAQLKRLACRCYRLIKREWDALFAAS